MPLTRSQLKRQFQCKKGTDSSSLPSSVGRTAEPLSKLRKQGTETDGVTLIRTLPEDNFIGALTTLDRALYVHHNAHPNLAVYDTETYHLQRRLPMPSDISSVADMASSRHYGCIYISDQSNKVIHRIEVRTTNTDDKFTKWNVDDEPWGLSVSAENNLVVSCWRVNKIKVFTTFGELLTVIVVAEVFHPLHTVQQEPDRLVICHGCCIDGKEDAVQRVCIVDDNGHVQQSFGSSPGSDDSHLHGPSRLAVVNGIIFVSEKDNHRVLMLSPSQTLRCVRTAVSKLKGAPDRMWFDDETGRLYLAENTWKNGRWTTGHVNVYSIGEKPA